MRLYLRKILILCVVLVFLWFVVSLVDEFPVKKTSNKYADQLESKIMQLERKLDNQLVESGKLLERVKDHLKNKQDSASKQLENNMAFVEEDPVLPVLVIACNRITVKRCLENLIKFRPDKETFPIIVSQDCDHEPTYQVIESFTQDDPTITVVKQPDQSVIPLERAKVKFRGYYNIARHYKFALDHVFVKLGHEAVIIVEDDLDISSDFYEYFLGTFPLLNSDPSIWCVSAWNDNGKKELVEAARPELLHRTDFFPGLGWMLRRDTWASLRARWPAAFFDDWLRNPENTQGRACIRPEISRTYSFGKVGVSKGLFFDLHLRYMQLNMEYVEFTKLNLTYLLKDKYDHAFTTLVYSLPEATADEVMAGQGGEGAVRVPYSTAKTYQRAAKRLGLMEDFRSGIPRTAYRGIVQCYVRGRRVYLAPDFLWTRYDPAWG
ncbi:alpha-1,3-mannosyl-glycoprotein 2-beta-N-acetylglucosaminyltransferase [Choristoneura fumiferana]|uniref:alpha-1,3-mannosyl-glycoprotein 2-beta-N-acetylglucosaminyltransferase n=1 Tax=Choristoneura fumiferana TaxID=7141 RepID=UPI003D15CF47